MAALGKRSFAVRKNFFSLLLLWCTSLLGSLALSLSAADLLNEKLQLLGTISNNGNGVALVKHRSTGKIKAIRLGADVFELATLIAVQSRSAVLRDQDGAEVVLSSKLAGARGPNVSRPTEVLVSEADRYAEEGFERVGTSIRVDSAYRDRMVSQELPTILMSAASEPVMENGKIKGFRLFQFEPNSIFEKMGMTDGDIVESVNGVPLNDVARTIQFLNGLKAENAVEVTISRNGRPVKLSLKVN